MVTRTEVETWIREIMGGLTKCRASFPHTGRLRYDRGNPPTYECECGMRYVKDGKGGLRDALAITIP